MPNFIILHTTSGCWKLLFQPFILTWKRNWTFFIIKKALKGLGLIQDCSHQVKSHKLRLANEQPDLPLYKQSTAARQIVIEHLHTLQGQKPNKGWQAKLLELDIAFTFLVDLNHIGTLPMLLLFLR